MAAVRRYDVLDTPPDGTFDRITAIAARVCDVPISTITIVDVDRIWFRSSHGLELDDIGRDPGLCASAIFRPGPYVVGDAASDPRTLDNPLVRGELGLRFYAAAPLTTPDGYRLGTLNVIDTRPRELTTEQLDTLEDLAAVVMDELELRLAARRTIELEATREAAVFRDQLLSGITHEMRTPLSILHGVVAMDDQWATDTGAEMREVLRRHVRHLDWLVTQFLEFARLEDGRMPAVRLEPLEVSDCVAEAASLHPGRVRVEAGTSPPRVQADRQRTVQVLMELIGNAVRTGDDEDDVHVHVEAESAETVAVAVTTRGPRLAPDELAAMLAPPEHAPGVDRQAIGLYVARALAEAQHGTLAAEPTTDGTRFTLRLPTAA